jgi:hypothetical protein
MTAEYQLPASLKGLQTETATYVRELPRLLNEKQAGRFVVIQGTEVCGSWDTYRDASQYAHERFGLGQRFLIHRVDERDADRLTSAPPPSGNEAACPP